MATFNSPVVAVAVVAADVVAVDAVAVVVAVAVAVLAGGAPAAHPGVRAAGAKRGHLPRVIDTNNNHGRVRHCRPGLCMCTSGVVCNALSAHRDPAEFPPH